MLSLCGGLVGRAPGSKGKDGQHICVGNTYICVGNTYMCWQHIYVLEKSNRAVGPEDLQMASTRLNQRLKNGSRVHPKANFELVLFPLCLSSETSI